MGRALRKYVLVNEFEIRISADWLTKPEDP